MGESITPTAGAGLSLTQGQREPPGWPSRVPWSLGMPYSDFPPTLPRQPHPAFFCLIAVKSTQCRAHCLNCFQVHNSVTFSTCTVSGSRPHCLLPERSCHPERRPHAQGAVTPRSLLPPAPGRHESAFCLCGFAWFTCWAFAHPIYAASLVSASFTYRDVSRFHPCGSMCHPF